MFHQILTPVVFWSAVIILGLYIIINGFYLLVHGVSLIAVRNVLWKRRTDPAYSSFDTDFVPGIAIMLPAYNEEDTIVQSVRSALDQNYPKTTVIVINDGSVDQTLDRLKSAYDLGLISEAPPWDLPCEAIYGIYGSTAVDDLIVIDKANGGKSDALNAGIWLTNQPLFCSIDADSLIDRNGLANVITPFIEHPAETIAAGGSVRVANACRIDGGQVRDVKISTKPLVDLQTIEYLRAFYSGRMGLSWLKSLLVISGTFGVFRTELVRDIGGYDDDTVTEDLDVVVRLHRHMRELGRSYRVEFVPEPVVWTQVPETLQDLDSQRRRWYRGLLQALGSNVRMFGNPSFGVIGIFALPFYFLTEGIGPLLEGYGYVLVPLAFLTGILNVEFFLTFLLVIIGMGIFLSWFGIFTEVWGFRRYDHPYQILVLMGYAVAENFGYRQWKTIVAWKGLIDFLRNETGWGTIERAPFSSSDGSTVREE